MTADERLALLEVKIKRAEKHFADLGAAGLAFAKTNPYRIATKRNPETRQLIYYVAGVEPLPSEVYALSGDIVHNLRTALDHLMWQLTIVKGSRTSETEIHFPIGNNPRHYETMLGGKIKALLRQDAVDALRSVEAYKGGKGEPFWLLNRLNNVDKHRLLIAVASSFSSVNVGPTLRRTIIETVKASGRTLDVPLLDIFIRPADICCPLKEGDELFTDVPDAEPDEKIQFKFQVSFNEPGIIERQPMFETLQHLTDLVRNTVTIFKPCLA